MITPNGTHGNLSVFCDSPGCAGRFDGRMPTEVVALRRGVVVVADVDPDFAMTASRVRRQARRRGWQVATKIPGLKSGFDVVDNCPEHHIYECSSTVS